MHAKRPDPETVDAPRPQLVRWGPVDHTPAGILVEDQSRQVFVPWEELKQELNEMLLPQVRLFPFESTVIVRDLDDRKDWLVRVVESAGIYLGSVWFGTTNPDNAWQCELRAQLFKPLFATTV
jgi:hypothetical protein